MAKNKSRSSSSAVQSGQQKKSQSNKSQNNKMQNGGSKGTDKAPEKPKEVLYQIRTQRDSGVLKAYITFTYRVFHPKVTARMVLYGLLIFVPGFFVKAQALKVVLWVLGGLVVLLGLFRQYISLALTKKSDEDYRNGTEFVYEFTQNDASFFRDGELSVYSSRYKDIDAIFYDEDYYYLSLTSREFFVIPMDRFTIGDPSTFGDFMYKKCKKVCRWIPAKFSNKLRKMRSQRAIVRDQMEKKKS
ncbi:MAG: YcxB family protein [Mogibacterium sp.]|nr:YcxB family protein [Mogibacterium sp.]